jgi:hypothetical protein
MDADSEDEDDEVDQPTVKIEDTGDDEDEDKSKVLLSIEDARKQGELAEGVRKIKVRLQSYDRFLVSELLTIVVAQTRTLRRASWFSFPSNFLPCCKVTFSYSIDSCDRNHSAKYHRSSNDSTCFEAHLWCHSTWSYR